MDKLTNHITVQSTRDFEKRTRNGKMLHSFSGPVLGFCLPSSLQWMCKSSTQSFDFSYQLRMYYLMCHEIYFK